jgi:hypothetical protein
MAHNLCFFLEVPKGLQTSKSSMYKPREILRSSPEISGFSLQYDASEKYA